MSLPDAPNCLLRFVYVVRYPLGLTKPWENDVLGKYKRLTVLYSGVEWVPSNCRYNGL